MSDILNKVENPQFLSNTRGLSFFYNLPFSSESSDRIYCAIVVLCNSESLPDFLKDHFGIRPMEFSFDQTIKQKYFTPDQLYSSFLSLSIPDYVPIKSFFASFQPKVIKSLQKIFTEEEMKGFPSVVEIKVKAKKVFPQQLLDDQPFPQSDSTSSSMYDKNLISQGDGTFVRLSNEDYDT